MGDGLNLLLGQRVINFVDIMGNKEELEPAPTLSLLIVGRIVLDQQRKLLIVTQKTAQVCSPIPKKVVR